MNSMQRTLTALSHQAPDRVPLFLLTTMHGARELGLSIEEYFANAKNVIEGQLRLHRKYRTDCLYGFYHASIEMEAWGGHSVFQPNGPAMSGDPVIQVPADIDHLAAPEISAAAGLNRVLETIRGLKAAVGDTVPIVGVAISPFSLPVMQMGFDRYLLLMHEDRRRFERLMDVNLAFSVNWANAQLAAGATAICYFDPVSSPTIIPPGLYADTGFGVAKRALSQIKGPTATHMASGRVEAILDTLVDTGTAIVSVSTHEDLSSIKKRAAGRISLIGNLNGIEMRHWTPVQAEFEVRMAIAKAAQQGGFLLSDNHGEIPWQVSDDVLLSISESVHRWGHYPLDWVDEWLAQYDGQP